MKRSNISFITIDFTLSTNTVEGSSARAADDPRNAPDMSEGELEEFFGNRPPSPATSPSGPPPSLPQLTGPAVPGGSGAMISSQPGLPPVAPSRPETPPMAPSQPVIPPAPPSQPDTPPVAPSQPGNHPRAPSQTEIPPVAHSQPGAIPTASAPTLESLNIGPELRLELQALPPEDRDREVTCLAKLIPFDLDRESNKARNRVIMASLGLSNDPPHVGSKSHGKLPSQANRAESHTSR